MSERLAQSTDPRDTSSQLGAGSKNNTVTETPPSGGAGRLLSSRKPYVDEMRSEHQGKGSGDPGVEGPIDVIQKEAAGGVVGKSHAEGETGSLGLDDEREFRWLRWFGQSLSDTRRAR
jgi:hypothetical protein